VELWDRLAGGLDMNIKAQEEIIGFILVVVMVVVIGLVFIFFLTPKPAERTDLELENLLYSWLSVSLENGDVKGLIESCYGECDLGQATDILDSAISKSGMINSINGYSLNITGQTEFSYSKGNLTGNARTAVVPLSNNDVKLKVYYP
jgi:hypothetical protein